MCQSIAHGGRRCPGGRSTPANTAPAVPAPSYAQADVELRAAQDEVNGGPAPVVGGLPAILTGALSRGRGIDEARQMVIGTLVGRGVPKHEADQRVARLEAAHAVWLATPED